MDSTTISDPNLHTNSQESTQDFQGLFKHAYKGRIKDKYHFD